jgi:hypothetical protein
MFVEIIVPRADLVTLLETALPLIVHLDGGGSLDIFGLEDVALVAGEGVRIQCKARLHWPALGISFQATLNAITVMLRPHVVKTEGGESLVLDAGVEHIDFAALPDFADEAIRTRVNDALRARHGELGIEFTKLLRGALAAPANVTPASTLSFEAAWGKLRIDAEAIVFVVSVRAEITRGAVLPSTAPVAVRPAAPLARTPISSAASLIFLGAAFVLGAAVATAMTTRARG